MKAALATLAVAEAAAIYVLTRRCDYWRREWLRWRCK